MIDTFLPQTPFNVITSPTRITPWELLAGPFGLAAFLPLIPLLRLASSRAPLVAIIAFGLVWCVATVGPIAALFLVAGLAAGIGWVELVLTLRRRGVLGGRGATAALWIGLNALILPLWWNPTWAWYGWQPSRMAPLHGMGFAYLMLRVLGWGLDRLRGTSATVSPPGSVPPVSSVAPAISRWSGAPAISGSGVAPAISGCGVAPAMSGCDGGLRATLAWLLYPPYLRLGPLVPREAFAQRLAAWRPLGATDWRALGQRSAFFLLGLLATGAAMRFTPRVIDATTNFFNEPQRYTAGQLWAVLYLVPIQAYLILWTYNELAAACGLAVGIPVDDNFRWAPLSTSVRDFWRRWHITLGAWLREYVYIPLGGGRRHAARNYTLVFLYCGVWHGAAWSYLAWGASQAVAIMVERGWDRLRARLGLPEPIRHPAWRGACWLATFHYQIVASLVLCDFEYCGSRILPELASRVVG